MSFLIEYKDEIQAVTNIAMTVGIVIALAVFIIDRYKDRRTREAEAYARSNDRYIHYLTLCLEHPQADTFDPDTHVVEADVERRIMFSILISTFETAYTTLYRASRRIRKRQWDGWQNYISMWAGEKDFVDMWNVIGGDFDSKFQDYLNGRIVERQRITSTILSKSKKKSKKDTVHRD
jgi:hypothetical protein